MSSRWLPIVPKLLDLISYDSITFTNVDFIIDLDIEFLYIGNNRTLHRSNLLIKYTIFRIQFNQKLDKTFDVSYIELDT